jgi:hypothetical protein
MKPGGLLKQLAAEVPFVNGSVLPGGQAMGMVTRLACMAASFTSCPQKVSASKAVWMQGNGAHLKNADDKGLARLLQCSNRVCIEA